VTARELMLALAKVKPEDEILFLHDGTVSAEGLYSLWYAGPGAFEGEPEPVDAFVISASSLRAEGEQGSMTLPLRVGPMAVHFTPCASRKIDLIVLHSMESSEKPNTAENVAAWFAGPKAPRASAHYCIDSDSIVQCVEDHDIAWHAPGANSRSLGLEHAGRASQSESDWLDEYSLQVLRWSAKLTAILCTKYRIPVRFVDALGLKAGYSGITTHAAVSDAFKKSTHWDPGPSFPLTKYLALTREAMEVFRD
jgi:N-acetyl-anhydromuramyl-L-alanine amidase AmpD